MSDSGSGIGGRWDAVVADDMVPVALFGVVGSSVRLRTLARAARMRLGHAAPEGRAVVDVLPGRLGRDLADAASAAAAGWWALELALEPGALGSGRLKVMPVGTDGDEVLVLVLGTEVETPLLDALTGLAARDLLGDRFGQAVASARRRWTGVAVLFIDLDEFKPVNDEHGHVVGDAVLREVARRIQSVLRGHDTVSRYGGDEFVAILEATADEALTVAERIVEVVDSPVVVADLAIQVGLSVGVAVFAPNDAVPALADAVALADQAMYAAKAAGGHRVEVA